MNKPNTIESVTPFSGSYSFRKDALLNLWLFVAVAVYVGCKFLLRDHGDWTPLARGSLALAPVVPGLFYLRSCLRFIQGMDELQRAIQLEVWLFAALVTLAVLVVVNVLNANGLAFAWAAQSLGFGGAYIIFFACWLLGNGIATCRYK